jgi:small subunit ribosomal protein S2
VATTTVVRSDLNIQDLLDAGLHFGHQTKRWNPKMKRYIFGERNGIYIIDLNQTQDLLGKARQFAYDTIGRGRKILFVGTKKQAQEPLKEAATRLKMPYVVNRWLGGTLTNLQTIRKSVAHMRDYMKLEADGTVNSMPKKEVSKMRRELEKLHYNLDGIVDMDNLPGAMFVVDVKREAIAVAEANRLKIPVIAVVDTNVDPDPVDYPIPGNDDAIRAVRIMVESISGTIQQAANEYAKIAADEARKRAAADAAAAAAAKIADEERKAKAKVAEEDRKAKEKFEKAEKAAFAVKKKNETDAKEKADKATAAAAEKKDAAPAAGDAPTA